MLFGAAVRVTVAPPSKLAAQDVPQSMPDGALVTLPTPVPAFSTVSGKVKRAETALAVSIVTAHVPAPVHAPDHPAKVAPESGLAVSVTMLPAS